MSATRRVIVMGAIAAAMGIGSPRAWAMHFRFELTVESRHGKAEAARDPHDQPDTDRPTPIMDVKHDEPLVVQFVVTCVYPHKIRKNTGVHYWISRQADDATPQTIDKSPPSENRDGEATADVKAVPLDGHFLVNFKPQGMAGLRQKLRLHDPGTYLLRVQSERSGSDHEHFSQMILRVH
jgi:hypothetical protein